MRIFRQTGPLRAFLKQQRTAGLSVGLVPTMGALHTGHASLIRASKKACDFTLCSLFVNPAQFNDPADLLKYPRDENADIVLLEAEHCDALFAPPVEAMYETNTTLQFGFDGLDKVLEGEFRPGHFSGVALVVSKLFNIIQPDRAYFGQKDYQQYLIIERLVEELKFNVELHCMPIVREADGLAMSSRNKRLNQVERKDALILYNCLTHAREALRKGKVWNEVLHEVTDRINAAGKVRLEYFQLADKRTLTSKQGVNPENSILLVAAYVGAVRLIDNMLVKDN